MWRKGASLTKVEVPQVHKSHDTALTVTKQDSHKPHLSKLFAPFPDSEDKQSWIPKWKIFAEVTLMLFSNSPLCGTLLP